MSGFGFGFGFSPHGALLNQTPEVPEGAILTEDGLNYLITEDEQYYLQYETEEE